MATTKRNRVGRTRRKLAAMLSEALSEDRGYPVTVQPEDLSSQVPVYASRHFDCCSWCGTAYYMIPGSTNPLGIHLSSWTQMGRIVREGKIGLMRPGGDRNEYEIA